MSKHTVETVAGDITLSPDPAVEVLDGAGVVEELVEDGNDGNGVALGANSGVVVTNSGEGHL